MMAPAPQKRVVFRGYESSRTTQQSVAVTKATAMIKGKEFEVPRTMFFVSHYKLEAGAKANLLHAGLCKLLNVPEEMGFLDSNSLADMNQLEEHVKATSVLVLLQTANVLFRRWVLVELQTALENNIPIVCVALQGKGYVFEDIAKMLADPAAMRKKIGDEDVKKLEDHMDFDFVCLQLSKVLPAKISMQFSYAAPLSTRQGMLQDIANAVQKATATTAPKLEIVATDATLHRKVLADAPVVHAMLNARVELHGHGNSVTAIDIAANSQFVVTGSTDCTVRVWDLDDRTKPIVLLGHKDTVRSVKVDRSGKELVVASGSADGSIRLWSPMQHDKTLRKEIALKAVVSSLAYDNIGKYLVAGCEDGALLRVHVASSTSTTLRWVAHKNTSASSVCFTVDSDKIISGGHDGLIKVWTCDGVLIRSLTGHGGPVTSLACSSNGKFIASTSFDKTIKIWGVDTYSLFATKSGHKDHVTGVAFSANSKQLVSSAKDKTVKLWEVTDKDEAGVVVHTFARIAYGVAFAPNQLFVAAGAGDHHAHMMYL